MSDESRGTIRRLTIEEVKAALDKTGFTLARRVTLSRARKCGCPIGVVAWADGKLKATDGGVPDLWGSAEAIGLIPAYAAGLIEGVDGTYSPIAACQPEYQLGRADGRAIAAALLPTGSEAAR